MKIMASFVSNVLRDKDGGVFVRHTTIDTDALGITPAAAKLELKRQAHSMARKLELGREGRDWDIILAELQTTGGKGETTESGLLV